MVVKKYLKFIYLAMALPVVFTSCKKASGDYPGDSYTWDMMYSRAYETYSLMPELKDSMSALMPVNGTVPYVGNPIAGTHADSLDMALNLPYTIPNTPEGYIQAGLQLKNPFSITDEKIKAEGQHFFNIYCAVCHGVNGDAKGYIVTEGKYTAMPPSYFDQRLLEMPEGTMFQSVTYGKNAMQSYAYALSKEERWKVITYVKSLQADYLAKQPATTDVAAKTN